MIVGLVSLQPTMDASTRTSRHKGIGRSLVLMPLLVLLTVMNCVGFAKETQTYIVHVDEPKIGALSNFHDRKKWYESFVGRATRRTQEEGSPESRILYAYQHVMTGFAARLSKDEVEAMQKIGGFVHAYADPRMRLHTSYSFKFVGLNPQKGLWPRAKFGKGVIIGVLDGGVWPESASFSDHGMPAVPARWKGVCEGASDFNASNCNNKLIGARVFNNADHSQTPRDLDGHGTHVASTAAGNFVANVDLLGNARGTASGMAAAAHLASYKICGVGADADCAGSDILAGIEAAIADGVDVLSLSLGDLSTVPFYMNTLAVGAFHAIEKGVFVSCAVGNAGPTPSTLSNDAPWIMSVGASTMDRSFIAYVTLGNGSVLYGESVFDIASHGAQTEELPLVHVATPNGTLCMEGTLNASVVAGKLVVCERGGGIGRLEKGQTVRNAGGAGMLLLNQQPSGEEVIAEAHVLPASHVGFKAGLAIKAYLDSTHNPTAAIRFEGTVFGIVDAPAVASSSSRGPSLMSPHILKPDVIAPGVAVLAAWPSNLNLTGLSQDKRSGDFNVETGTSMACPHVSGLAALLKSAHPDWSPAAIKSALMTTASVTTKRGRPILDSATSSPADLFAMGAGHVDAAKAADPGLVYDLAPMDYVPYLCALNYTAHQIRLIVNKQVTCPPAGHESSLPGNLNYPSFAVLFTHNQTYSSITFKRRVTNVGPAASSYCVDIAAPKGVQVEVHPPRLHFTPTVQERSYTVTFTTTTTTTTPLPSSSSRGYLTWVSSPPFYRVRSPIAVTWS